MTKADLLAAIAEVPDTALIYIDSGDGVLRSHVGVSYETDSEGAQGSIVLDWMDLEDDA